MEPRHKVQVNGRKIKLCNGRDNTCTNEAKKDGVCIGCTTGRSGKDFLGRKDGDEWTDSRGIRYRKVGGQSRQLCIGDDDTCTHIRADATNLCVGHKNGTVRMRNADYEKDQIVEFNGEIRRYNGKQLVKLCDGIIFDKRCTQYVTVNGKCKSHAPEWKCRYTGYQCDNIRFDDYCIRHTGDIENERIKSKGETAIADVLDKYGVRYENNKRVKNEIGKTMYLDFYLIDFDAVIEFDGKQHFEVVKHWEGEYGLEYRQENDREKNEWCERTHKSLLRIRYDEMYILEISVVCFIACLMVG